MSSEQFVLYTYQTVAGRYECHAFGLASQDEAEQAGRLVQQKAEDARENPLGYMVLPLEAMPV